MEKVASPALLRAVAALTAGLAATTVRDVAKSGVVPLLRGKPWPATAAWEAAGAKAGLESLRLRVAREDPLGYLLPARAAHAAGRTPITVVTTEGQYARALQRIEGMPREEARRFAAKGWNGRPFFRPALSQRLPAPDGRAHIEGIVGGPRRVNPESTLHELGHLRDLEAGGPMFDDVMRDLEESPVRHHLSALAEKLVGPVHQRRTMAMERAAWAHVPKSPILDELRETALGTYQAGFHMERAPLAAAATTASGALLAALHLRARGQDEDEPMTEKTAFDPLTAGTAAAMLPALLLRVLGTGGYAGKLSRGAGWRRPVVAATDLAVNRAAEGVGDLAMATASLNWTIRKTMEAARAGRTVETPSLEEQEADLLTPFATGFDEEMGKHAGLLDKALSKVLPVVPGKDLREVGEYFLKNTPRPAHGLSLLRRLKKETPLRTQAKDTLERFDEEFATKPENKFMADLRNTLPKNPFDASPAQIKNVVNKALDPKAVVHGRKLFRGMFPEQVKVSFVDEMNKLAARPGPFQALAIIKEFPQLAALPAGAALLGAALPAGVAIPAALASMAATGLTLSGKTGNKFLMPATDLHVRALHHPRAPRKFFRGDEVARTLGVLPTAIGESMMGPAALLGVAGGAAARGLTGDGEEKLAFSGEETEGR